MYSSNRVYAPSIQALYVFIYPGSADWPGVSNAVKNQYTYTFIEGGKKPHFPGTPKNPDRDSDFF